MASKKNYSRFFIILQEDDKNYGISIGKIPTGYAKIEIKNSKCKISYYVQNLKLNEKYYMVIICGKNGENKLINIGNMVLDEQGRIDTSYEYDMNNIAGTSISYDKIIGAAVVKKNQRNVMSIMSGFMTCNVPDNWQNYELIDSKNSNDEQNVFEQYEKSIEESKTSQVRLTEEKKLEDKKRLEEEKRLAEEKKDDAKLSDKKVEDKLDDTKMVEKELSNPKVNSKELDQKIELDKQAEYIEKNNQEINEKDMITEDMQRKNSSNKVSKKDNKCIQDSKYKKDNKLDKKYYDYSKCMNSCEKFFMSLVDDCEELFDVVYNIKNCKWFKVNVKDFDDLCNMSNYDKYVVLKYPMISYYQYIRKYGHFLIGYKYDKDNKIKYIIYAIPGGKNINCQPYQGRTGFVTWLKCKDDKLSDGYWLMFYDYKTSKVLIPIKKNKKCYDEYNK